MESLQTILKVIQMGDWLLSVDLRDANFHVPVAPFYQRFLRFAVGQLHHQFACLPFELTTSPRVFTKILVDHLRLQGIHIHHYLDDILLLSQDKDTLLALWKTTLLTLESFGWLINQEKSHIVLTQSLVYLGAKIDTRMASVTLPRDKMSCILKTMSEA